MYLRYFDLINSELEKYLKASLRSPISPCKLAPVREIREEARDALDNKKHITDVLRANKADLLRTFIRSEW